MSTIAEFAEYLTKALTDDPDAVSIREIEGERTTLIQLSLSPDDRWRLVEEQREVSDAIYTLLSAITSKGDKYVLLEINGKLFKPQDIWR